MLERCPAGARRRHRPRRARPRAQPRPARAVRRAGHASCTRCTTRSPTCSPTSASRTSTACSSTSASPRCSSTSASAASPTPRTRRSTCGWTTPTGPDRGRRAQRPTPPRSWPGSCGSTARRSSPAGSPSASSGSARQEPFTRSARLVELLYDAIPAPARRTGGHPAKRTFQALRIEVNDELRCCAGRCPAAIDAIGVGGRVVVMSYHSLEDRITKQAFADRDPQRRCPPDLPFVPEGHEPALRLVTRGAEKAVRGRDRCTTPALLRCGCAPSSAFGPELSHDRAPAGEQPRRGQTTMSTLMNQARSRVPADRRGGRRAGPADRRAARRDARGRAGALRDAGVAAAGRRRRRAAVLQHLHAAGLVQGHGAGGPGRRRSTRSSRACRWTSTRLRDPQRVAAAGEGDGHGPAEHARPSSSSPTARSSASRSPPPRPTRSRSTRCRPASRRTCARSRSIEKVKGSHGTSQVISPHDRRRGTRGQTVTGR